MLSNSSWVFLQSLRALYGTEKLFNAVHGCDDKEQASRELGFFFPNFGASSEAQNLAEPDQRVEKTLALIRPDILKERKGEIDLLNTAPQAL